MFFLNCNQFVLVFSIFVRNPYLNLAKNITRLNNSERDTELVLIRMLYSYSKLLANILSSKSIKAKLTAFS